jgi:hypothetical protein
MNDSNEEWNESLSEFEQALTRALRPVNPPERVARFLALAAEGEAERSLPRRERSRNAGRWGQSPRC